MIQVTVRTDIIKYCFQMDEANKLYAEWSEIMSNTEANSETYQNDEGIDVTYSTYRPKALDCNAWHCGEKVTLKKSDITSIEIVDNYAE